MNLIRRFFSQPSSQHQEAPSAPKPTEILPATAEIAPVVEVTPPAVTAERSRAATAILDGVTRPLSPDSVSAYVGTAHLSFGQVSDVGKVRSNNQDAGISFFVTSRTSEERPDFGLFIVADGMGGHLDGEKASAITARTIAGEITSKIYLPMLIGKEDEDRPPITETLIEAVQKANSEVITHVPDGGTTLTMAVIVGDLAYIAHVGDSRIYLITRDGFMEQLTRDHSIVQRLIELDQLSPEDVADHPQKNVLYRALGQTDGLEVDTLTRRLPPGAKLMLCSDGLWNMVEEREIREVLVSPCTPLEACERLVALANKHGGQDNITVILLQLPG